MARPRKQNGASRPGPEGGKTPRSHIKTSFNFDLETHKLLAIASLETGLDMGEILTKLVHQAFGGWHVRRGRGGGLSLPGFEFAEALEQDPEEGLEDKPPAKSSGKRAPREGQATASKDSRNFGVLTERSAHLDHDKAVEDLALSHDKVIDEIVGGEEAA